MARPVHGLPCAQCGTLFESLDDFDKHLPCHFKEARFKEIPGGSSPVFRQAEFLEAEFEDPEGAVWASETTRERVDARLHSRRIRAITWEPEEVPDKSIWKRFWEWLTK